MKMTIIGHGFVGKAVDYGFSGVKKQIVDPIYGVSLSDIKLNEDVTFVCVPTPMGENGEIDCSIVSTLLMSYHKDNQVLLLLSQL